MASSGDQPTQEFEINGPKNNPENLSQDYSIDGFNSSSCKNCSGASIPSSANIYPFCNKPRSLNFTSDQTSKRPKKISLEPPENNATAAIPSFRRCCTFPPFSSFPADPSSPPPVPVKAAAANNLRQSPPLDSVKIAESLPPRPPFKRCPSDPSSMKSFSRSASNYDLNFDGSTSDYQRLKWMKDYTKEMSQLFDDVLPDETVAQEEEELDKDTAEDDSTDNIIKANLVTDSEEVYVERTGDDRLIVHFKCSYGKGLHIVLSGANCYYKLLK